MKEYTIELVDAKKITPNTLHCAFKRVDGAAIDFIPGQFITLHFRTAEQNKRRSYSLSTVYGKSDLLEIALSYVPSGVASEAIFTMKPGDQLSCSGPFGRLILRETDEAKRLLLVATGTGVSPYRAMLPQLAQRMEADPELKVVLLLGVQYRTDLLYKEDFTDFARQYPAFDFRACYSRETLTTGEAYEYSGYVQSMFDQLELDPDDDLVFLCGNPNMIDQAFAHLTEEGFSPKRVKREKYISSN